MKVAPVFRVAALLLVLAVAMTSCSKKDKTTAPTGREMDSGSIGAGFGFEHTFANAGDYPYHCSFHGGMRGTVHVVVGNPDVVQNVTIANASTSGFQNASVTIQPGGKVVWTNADVQAHTVTSD